MPNLDITFNKACVFTGHDEEIQKKPLPNR